MEPKDRFDAYMKLSDFRVHRWDARREFEIKVSVALWALLAATAAVLKVRPDSVLLAALLLIVVAGHALFFLVPIWTSNKLDIETAFCYAEMAERELSSSIQVRPKPAALRGWSSWKGAASDWGVRFQILTTTILALGVWLLAGHISS